MTPVSTTNLSLIAAQAYQAPSKSTSAQALVALATALQSGTVSDAQGALASYQQTLADDSGSVPTPPYPTNERANTDYADLVTNVQAGNLSDAEAALTKLQIDLRSSRTSHHHEVGVPVPTTTIDTSDRAASLQTDSTSGNYVNVTV